MGFGIIHFRMLGENPGQIGGQGTVHINRHLGNLFVLIQHVNGIKQFLGTAEGKGRNQDGAATLHGFGDDLFKAGHHIRNRIMVPVPVGPFHDEQVDVSVRFVKIECRVIDDRLVEATDIAGISHRVCAAVGFGLDDGDGRPENMPGIIEHAFHVSAHGHGAPVRHAVKRGQGVLRVLLGIKRLNGLHTISGHHVIDGLCIEPVFVSFQNFADFL